VPAAVSKKSRSVAEISARAASAVVNANPQDKAASSSAKYARFIGDSPSGTGPYGTEDRLGEEEIS
jgi:hypothetical protein